MIPKPLISPEIGQARIFSDSSSCSDQNAVGVFDKLCSLLDVIFYHKGLIINLNLF